MQFLGSPFRDCTSTIILAPKSEFIQHGYDIYVEQLNVFDKQINSFFGRHLFVIAGIHASVSVETKAVALPWCIMEQVGNFGANVLRQCASHAGKPTPLGQVAYEVSSFPHRKSIEASCYSRTR